MNDADQQRLNEIQLDAIRSKLRRLNGHKEWSPKQFSFAMGLARDAVELDDRTNVDELSKLFQ